MPYFEGADPTRLFYRDWGRGAPVVFCAAWSLSSVQFQYQMIHMVDAGCRAISYDRRGHGRSDDPGTGYDYDTLADDLAALIDHLDLHEVTLVAHSMAGGEAARYISRHGDERVARILLLATTLPFPKQTETNLQGIDPSMFEAVRTRWRQDYGQWLKENEGPYFGDGLPGCAVSESAREWTKSDMLATSLLAAIECNRAIADTDFRDELQRLAVPTLIIQGDRDASIPIELSGQRQAELIPNSRLVVYENAPHGLYVTHRDRLNADLLRFVGQTGAGRQAVPQAAEAV